MTEFNETLIYKIGKQHFVEQKLELTNAYALRTLLNTPKQTSHDALSRLASKKSLEHRRFEQANCELNPTLSRQTNANWKKNNTCNVNYKIKNDLSQASVLPVRDSESGISSLLNCLSCRRGKRRLYQHVILSACTSGCPPQTIERPPPYQSHLSALSVNMVATGIPYQNFLTFSLITNITFPCQRNAKCQVLSRGFFHSFIKCDDFNEITETSNVSSSLQWY